MLAVMRARNLLGVVSFLCLSGAIAGGCSSDDDAAPPAAAAAGGSGGAAGKGGASGASGGGGGVAPGPVGPLGERADLPVDERIYIDGLSAPVDVVRDKYGRPHIFAETPADAMRAEGFMVARDRHAQLDFLRRAAEGRLAETLGDLQSSLIDTDIGYRHIGLHRVAKKQYESLTGELKELLDAYSDGITQAFRKIQTKKLAVPNDVWTVWGPFLTDWTGADSLAIGRLQTHLLSYDAEDDVSTSAFFTAARSTFDAAATDPLVKKRVGFEMDTYRFAPPTQATTTSGWPMGPAPTAGTSGFGGFQPNKDLLGLASGYRRAMKTFHDMFAPEGFGSNNWAVNASRTATGHAMVASDPHLSLPAPSIFWPVAMHVTGKGSADPAKDFHVSGISFPGIPGIILGHSDRIAWGATVAYHDVTDVYQEKLTADGSAVVYQGNEVPIETVDEVIQIAGGTSLTYKVRIVPHHGPIIPTITSQHTVDDPDPAKGALSVRWTGLEATNEIAAVFGLHRAKNVDEAYQALQDFSVGAQNWMLGDTNGDILWTTHAKVPTRAAGAVAWDPQTYKGQLPCMVLPGDGSAEWTGWLADDKVPWAKNPSKGYLATANQDPIGNTLDNDPTNDALPDGTPMFLQCSYDPGFREARIQERIEATSSMTLEEMASIQGDAKSPLGVRFAPRIITAIDRAKEEVGTPGKASDLATIVSDPTFSVAALDEIRDLLATWDSDGAYLAAAGVDLDTGKNLPEDGETRVEARAARATLFFNWWLMRFTVRVLGDELAAAGNPPLDRAQKIKALLHLFEADPATLATYDAATKESALWDDMTTTPIESKDERVLRALLDALSDIAKLEGGAAAQRWGSFHRVSFASINPLWGSFSIPNGSDDVFGDGFPRHGDLFVVDASQYGGASTLTAKPSFTYSSGPTQRFVIDLDPAGPRARNALPGGVIWDPKSPHFRDEAEYWRKNQNHEIPWGADEAVAAKEARIVASVPAP
jgi:penicillin G amidase